MARNANLASLAAPQREAASPTAATEYEEDDVGAKEGPSEKRRTTRMRMTVDFPAKIATLMVWLKEQTQSPSFVEILRKAVQIMEIVVVVYNRGDRFEIVKKDGAREPVHFRT